MFFLISDTYSIVMGNSYNSNSEIYVGTLAEAIGRDYVCFQNNTKINPSVFASSTGLDVSGDITYTLTMLDGNMIISASLSNGSTWSTAINGMSDVTFNKLGFMNDGDLGTSGVKNITITSPTIPEPTTATLSPPCACMPCSTPSLKLCHDKPSSGFSQIRTDRPKVINSNASSQAPARCTSRGFLYPLLVSFDITRLTDKGIFEILRTTKIFYYIYEAFSVIRIIHGTDGWDGNRR